jgi:hypothetical protein
VNADAETQTGTENSTLSGILNPESASSDLEAASQLAFAPIVQFGGDQETTGFAMDSVTETNPVSTFLNINKDSQNLSDYVLTEISSSVET